jgi:hypothetical protein
VKVVWYSINRIFPYLDDFKNVFAKWSLVEIHQDREINYQSKLKAILGAASCGFQPFKFFFVTRFNVAALNLEFHKVISGRFFVANLCSVDHTALRIGR